MNPYLIENTIRLHYTKRLSYSTKQLLRRLTIASNTYIMSWAKCSGFTCSTRCTYSNHCAFRGFVPLFLQNVMCGQPELAVVAF
jgi:hypothetical protein